MISSDDKLVEFTFDPQRLKDHDTYLYHVMNRMGPYRYEDEIKLPYTSFTLSAINEFLNGRLISIKDDSLIDALDFLLLIRPDRQYQMDYWFALLHEEHWLNRGAIHVDPNELERGLFELTQDDAANLLEWDKNDNTFRPWSTRIMFHRREKERLYRYGELYVRGSNLTFNDVIGFNDDSNQYRSKENMIPLASTALNHFLKVPILDYRKYWSNDRKINLIYSAADILGTDFNPNGSDGYFMLSKTDVLVGNDNGEFVHIQTPTGTITDAIFAQPTPSQRMALIDGKLYCTATCLWSLRYSADILTEPTNVLGVPINFTIIDVADAFDPKYVIYSIFPEGELIERDTHYDLHTDYLFAGQIREGNKYVGGVPYDTIYMFDHNNTLSVGLPLAATPLMIQPLDEEFDDEEGYLRHTEGYGMDNRIYNEMRHWNIHMVYPPKSVSRRSRLPTISTSDILDREYSIDDLSHSPRSSDMARLFPWRNNISGGSASSYDDSN